MDKEIMNLILQLADKGGYYAIWAIIAVQILSIVKVSVNWIGAIYLFKWGVPFCGKVIKSLNQ
jgi:hypothetical protein